MNFKTKKFLESVYSKISGEHKDPAKLYNSIICKIPIIRRHELRRLSKDLCQGNDHQGYEKLLKQFVPNWILDIEESEFLNVDGRGGLSFNVYRKVRVHDKWLFEKVYFSSYSEVERILWADQVLFDAIEKKGIKIPRIRSVFEAKDLTIIYFEYFDLKLIQEDQFESKLIELSKILYEISVDSLINKSTLETPKNICQFRKENHYQYSFKLAKKRLAQNNINYLNFEKHAENTNYVIMHGDTREANVFNDDIIIDWDTLGIYPIGMEPALTCLRLYARIYEKDEDAMVLDNWLIKHYKEFIPEEEWLSFKINFTYFLYVFAVRRFDEGKASFMLLEQHLLDNLMKYSNSELGN